jgi:hypothetical protein
MPMIALYAEPPAGLVATGLTIQTTHSASEGPRIEDLVPIEVYLSPLAWHAAIVREVARQTDRDEARAVFTELDGGGALATLSESRRLGLCSYARRLPAAVAGDLLAFHREWSVRGWSTLIACLYPEAKP